MEFTIKPAKQKKRGKGSHAAIDDCQLAHCLLKPDHCTRRECRQRLNSNRQSLENEKLALSFSLDNRIAETKRLFTEIQEECNLDAFGNDNMSSSFATFKAGIGAKATKIACECPECGKEQASAELGLVAKRLAITQDWLAALREYRSNNDLEVVRRPSGQSTKYFSGGNYFQRVGTYRGHGASAIKPRLQMQNSYNVAALTKNDMMERPLKQAPEKKQIEAPKRPVIPGLRGKYTQQADGSVLVHDGSYTTGDGETIPLHDSMISFKGRYVYLDVEEDDDYSSDDFTSSDDDDDEDDEEDDEDMGWEVEFQHLMDNLML